MASGMPKSLHKRAIGVFKAKFSAPVTLLLRPWPGIADQPPFARPDSV
jgi:hypothetical protein